MMPGYLKDKHASATLGATCGAEWRLHLKGRFLAHQLGKTDFDRHIRACNNARLPGMRRPFRIGSDQVGWLPPAILEALRDFPTMSHDSDGATLLAPRALPAIARTLAERGLFR